MQLKGDRAANYIRRRTGTNIFIFLGASRRVVRASSSRRQADALDAVRVGHVGVITGAINDMNSGFGWM